MSTVETTERGDGYVGRSLKRKEDPRLITGRATYVDDLSLPGLLYAGRRASGPMCMRY